MLRHSISAFPETISIDSGLIDTLIYTKEHRERSTGGLADFTEHTYPQFAGDRRIRLSVSGICWQVWRLHFIAAKAAIGGGYHWYGASPFRHGFIPGAEEHE